MPNFFKALHRQDEDEELDLEFDIAEADNFELPPDREDNQILAVWGSPSSGKTVMSVKLARYIASQKKNVILVLKIYAEHSEAYRIQTREYPRLSGSNTICSAFI